jgi:tetratricopeptide (TPR) repeat protein
MAGLNLFDQEREQIDAAWDWVLQENKSKPTQDTDELLLKFALATFGIDEIRYTPSQMIDKLEPALFVTKQRRDKRLEGSLLNSLGRAYLSVPDNLEKAIGCFEQSLKIGCELEDCVFESSSLSNLGNAYRVKGEMEKAIGYIEKALEISRYQGDRPGEGAILGNLGFVYCDLGDTEKAIDCLKEALEINRHFNIIDNEGRVLRGLGNVYLKQGLINLAIESYQEAFVIIEKMRVQVHASEIIWHIGLAYAVNGQFREAESLMDFPVKYLQSIAHPLAAKYVAALEEVRQQLAEEEASSLLSSESNSHELGQ